MSQFFASGGQSIEASASAYVLPMNIQGWFPLVWTGLISLQSKGLSRVFSNTRSKPSIHQHTAFFMVQLSYPYMTTGKARALTRRTFVGKIMFLLFTLLSRFAIAFLPSNKCLLISWLQSPSWWFWNQENAICHCFHFVPTYLPWSDETGCYNLSFLNVEFKPAFSLSCFTFIKRLSSSSSLSAVRVVSSA